MKVVLSKKELLLIAKAAKNKIEGEEDKKELEKLLYKLYDFYIKAED